MRNYSLNALAMLVALTVSSASFNALIV